MIDLRGSHRVAQSVEESLVAGHVANTDERGLGAQRSNFVLNSGHDLSAHDQQGGTRVNDHLYINNAVIKQVQKRKRSDRVKKYLDLLTPFQLRSQAEIPMELLPSLMS